MTAGIMLSALLFTLPLEGGVVAVLRAGLEVPRYGVRNRLKLVVEHASSMFASRSVGFQTRRVGRQSAPSIRPRLSVGLSFDQLRTRLRMLRKAVPLPGLILSRVSKGAAAYLS